MLHQFYRGLRAALTPVDRLRRAEPLSRGSDGFPDELDFTPPNSCYNTGMAVKPTKQSKKPAKPGPKAETLKLSDDWKGNIAKSMQMTKPAEG